ncbi:mediator of RNA polymerase II transcription subunit 15a-like isoform X4 [Alnus glutinosa]|uniref:mediator of RNA polymerase II transcription subunit 15a-like isoform X4 n=1 Tax=Alnus glutinosa TaxID=3517 RepID=UPI002D794A2B|nr:mediator of RNA polymerase II transcription subunit 15a-like isoform X4 [Alnus glutinosa]
MCNPILFISCTNLFLHFELHCCTMSNFMMSLSESFDDAFFSQNFEDINNWSSFQALRNMEASDWRAKVLPESRKKIVVKIIETLKECVPSSKRNDLPDIKKLAESFEEKTYAAAKDENEYIMRISLKLMNVREISSRTVLFNSSQSRPSCSGETPEPHGIQSQVDKHGQSLNPHSTNHSQHQLSRNAENNIVSSGIYASLPSAQPPLSDLTVTAMPNAVTEVSNLQTTSGISRNSVGNSVGQGMYSDFSPNNLIQVQGRQHSLQVVTQQNHQRPQKLLQDSYQLQRQPQRLNQFKQDYIAPSQSSVVSDHLQSRQSSCQQLLQPLLMKHPQTVLIQPQPTQQVSVTHQSESPMQGKPLLPSHQQPQLMKKNMAATIMTQNRLMGQQSSAPYSLQQRQGLPCLQNNSQNLQQEHLQGQKSNTHQQQLAGQSNFSVLQQQQQLLGKQCDNLSMCQTHVAMKGQTQQTASALLPTQGQQLQPPLPERQLVSQSQTEKVQQLPNPSQQDRMENFQRSGALNPKFEKRFANIGDWQEEVYQKVEGLKIRYLKQLNGLWQTLTNILLQHGSVPQQPRTGKIEKLMLLLKQIIVFLNLPKNKITPAHSEQLDTLEKKISFVLHSTGKKSVSSTQQGKLYPDVQSVQQLPQPQTQTSQVQRLEDQKIPQLQSTVSESTVTAIQQNNLTSLQHDSKSHLSEPATLQQNMMHSIDHLTISEKENSVEVMQQVAKGSLRSPASIPQQANFNTLLSRSHMNVSQSSVTPLELSSDTLQNMHLKQTRDHLDVLTQKPKQEFQKHKMQHQLVHQNYQILQRQQAEEKQQNQLNDVNDLKVGLGMTVKEPHHQKNAVNDSRVKRGMGIKSGLILQHQSGGLPSVYNSQHSDSGASFPISSPKVSCSPLAQHSTWIDLQNLPAPLTETRSHFHTANSTSAIPSSSLIQSSMSGSCEKLTSDTSSFADAENAGHHGPSSQGPGTSLVICTSGMSASPFLEESSALDGIDSKMSTIISDKLSVAEQPLQRLINVVSSISSQAFSASITDIGSVMCLTDWISSSPPVNGSRASIGEDLVAMTKSCLQARYLPRHSDSSGTRKMKRLLSAMPTNIYPINGSIHDGCRQWIDMEKPELESSTTSSTKRPRIEAKHVLLEEIREINQQLIDTVVVISDEDTIPTAAATEGGQGTIVKCSFSAVAISPNFKSQQLPIQPLRLLVPSNYPNTSPILLDEKLLDARSDHQDLSVKVKSKLNLSLLSLQKPLSLGKIARMWDFCARAILCEYAQQNGGGNFSSRYGTWENCLSAA